MDCKNKEQAGKDFYSNASARTGGCGYIWWNMFIYLFVCEQTRDETSNYDMDQWLKVQKHFQRYHYDYVVNTVIPPSVFVTTMLWAAGPHATAVAEAALLNGSDHCLVDLVYCWTVTPLGPPVSRNWPV